MNTVRLVVIPTDAELIEIAKTAAAQHLKFIWNGKRRVLCSEVPNGWKEINVSLNTVAEVA